MSSAPGSTSETLVFRTIRPEDRPALEQLWEEETRWGPLTPGQWSRFYEDNLNGSGLVVVATDLESSRVVGQFLFVAAQVSIHGRIISACRAYAPIVGKGMRMFRSPNLYEHPLFQMHAFGLSLLRERGVGLVYTIADPKWIRMLRMMPDVNLAVFELWSLPLPVPAAFALESDCTVEPLLDHPGDVNEIWDRASALHNVIVRRDAAAMNWRLDGATGVVVRRAHRPVGLACLQIFRKLQQYLISDLLAIDDSEALRTTLVAVCNLARELSFADDPTRPMLKICLLGSSPCIQPILQELGFERDPHYTYPLLVHNLDPALSPNEIAADRWYLTAND